MLSASFSFCSIYRVLLLNGNGYLSKPRPTHIGAIRGSAVSSLLFRLYITDILHTNNRGITFMITDYFKTVYKFPARDHNTIPDEVKYNLLSLGSRCRAWSMSFEAQKCTIHAQKCHIPTEVFEINQEFIPSLCTVRVLGFH